VDDGERRDELARRLGGADWSRQQDFLKNPLIRTLGKALGVDFGDLDQMSREVHEGFGNLLQAAIWFAPFGWYVSAQNLRASDYDDAVTIWNNTPDPELIDAHLARAWNDLTWLRHSYGPMVTLAGRHEPTGEILLARSRLIDKAVDHHRNGDYAASTLILLTQIDGLTFDFTDGQHGFFYRAKDDFFEDDDTLAGMPEFLKTVRKGVNRDVNRTSDGNDFHRNASIHGRSVGFATEVNSAKSFALLSGVIEWLRPKAAIITEQWLASDEARYAGSDERDERGRLRDRRGFVEVRDSLRWLAIREVNEHRTRGRYNDDLPTMFPKAGVGRMKRRDSTALSVSADGQNYWATCPTDTKVWFGIGARDGEVASYFYVGESPPGPLGKDSRWVHEFDDQSPDWDGY
jgi:hypothetical protein